MRLLAWCLMPNHWHLVLWPRADGDLGRFVRRLTQRHTQAWHRRHGTRGQGHLYQGRYKAFLVQDDAHLLTVCRYVERNPLRAGLVAAAARLAARLAARNCAAGGRRGCSTPGRCPARRLGRGGRPARDRRRSSKPCAARCSAARRSAPPPGWRPWRTDTACDFDPAPARPAARVANAGSTADY